MTKYYFASYITNNGINTINGCIILRVNNMDLVNLCEFIRKENNFTDKVVITSLKDLTYEEYVMLVGKDEDGK